MPLRRRLPETAPRARKRRAAPAPSVGWARAPYPTQGSERAQDGGDAGAGRMDVVPPADTPDDPHVQVEESLDAAGMPTASSEDEARRSFRDRHIVRVPRRKRAGAQDDGPNAEELWSTPIVAPGGDNVRSARPRARGPSRRACPTNGCCAQGSGGAQGGGGDDEEGAAGAKEVRCACPERKRAPAARVSDERMLRAGRWRKRANKKEKRK